MSTIRALAVFLICLLVAQPVLAAQCALSCSGGTQAATALSFNARHAAQQQPVAGMDMAHCHDAAATPMDDDTPPAKDHAHPQCMMAGCHATPAAIAALPLLAAPDVSQALPSGLASGQVPADLPPPLKPPA